MHGFLLGYILPTQCAGFNAWVPNGQFNFAFSLQIAENCRRPMANLIKLLRA